MKRIFLSVVTLVVALSVGAWATRAAWTDDVTTTGNVISTGSADLQVATDHTTFAVDPDDTEISGLSITGLTPGFSDQEYAFSLRTVGVPTMLVTAQITGQDFTPGADPSDLSQLQINVYDESDMSTPLATDTLGNWIAAPISIGSATTTAKHYVVKATLLSTADNDWQNQTLTFTLSIHGQTP